MNILFATAHPFLPQMRGGMQFTSNTIAESLLKKGHQVTMLSALMPNGFFGFKQRLLLKLTGKKAIQDSILNYPIYRSWFPWEGMASVLDKVKPDLVVILASQPVKMAQSVKAVAPDLPIVIMLQDVEFDKHGGPFEALGNIPCIANSSFTAQRYRDNYDVDPIVIHPVIYGDKYKTQTIRENVTFINPNPVKGLEIALKLAQACPEIPFRFVEGWPLTDEQLADLNKQLASLDNVSLQRSTSDMKSIYGKAKIVLAPSIWEEAYGRVATEAQHSGIPVLASNRGGLPEAVGTGGITLDPDGPIENWITALKKLWSDGVYYQEMSEAALSYANRVEVNVPHQMDLFENAFKKVIATGSVK